jgi:hypothetical protein
MVTDSEYNKLKEKGMGRGRPRHTPEQKEKAQIANSARQEARRRAHLVLKSRHIDEYIEIYNAELSALLSSEPEEKKKRTRK